MGDSPRLVVTLALALGACRALPEPAVAPGQRPVAAETAGVSTNWSVAGTSVQGRPLHHATFGNGETTVLVLASIHGDEAAGTPLVLELCRRLEEDPPWLAGRRVAVMPEVNPDGVALERRGNARGVDLNRNFPAVNRREHARYGPEALSEPESRVVHQLVLELEVDRVVTFHQAANLVDYDGPAADIARAMSEASGLPLRRMGSRPGSLGSWAGEDLGLAVVTVELPRSADRASPDELWERYGPLLVEAIRAP